MVGPARAVNSPAMAVPLNHFSPPPPPTHGPYGPFSMPPSSGQPPPPASQYQPPFYPITVGRAVSLSFSLYRFAWRTLVAISLITTVPVALISAAAAAYTYEPMNAWEQTYLLGRGPSGVDVLSTFPWSSLALTAVASLVAGPIAILGGAALVQAISKAISGGRPHVGESFRAAFGKLRDLMVIFVILVGTGVGLSLVGVLFPVLTALGPSGVNLAGPVLFGALILFVALAFAAAFVTIRLVFTLQALMIEDQHAPGAVRRTWQLASGSMWRIIGWAFVFSLLVGLLSLVFEVIAAVIGFVVAPPHFTRTTFEFNPAFLLVFTFLFTALESVVAPIMSIGLTLLYFDIRHKRHEQVPEPGRPTGV
jgi:glycerophosphoryl diester phosphodiesterase family protein